MTITAHPAQELLTEVDELPDAASIAEPIIAALDHLRETLGESFAVHLETAHKRDWTADENEQWRAAIVHYWDTTHFVAQLVAAFTASSTLERRQAAYDHAHGLVMALTGVEALSWLTFFEPEL